MHLSTQEFQVSPQWQEFQVSSRLRHSLAELKERRGHGLSHQGHFPGQYLPLRPSKILRFLLIEAPANFSGLACALRILSAFVWWYWEVLTRTALF